jgi:hypothetical protein
MKRTSFHKILGDSLHLARCIKWLQKYNPIEDCKAIITKISKKSSVWGKKQENDNF